MGRKEVVPRVIPEQNKRICFSICFCTMSVVLSIVSIVYLSAAIYGPSYKAFNSGFELEPVMCQTIDFTNITGPCPWASCGEWCLTKTSGFCPQINATVRRNGTEIILNNCTYIDKISCPQINPDEILEKYNCNNDTLCPKALHGVFQCEIGFCRNLSQIYDCRFTTEETIIHKKKDKRKLKGYFYCFGSKCKPLTKPPICDRYCSNITTVPINIILKQNNSVNTAKCLDGFALTEARGSEPGIRIPPTEIWNDSDDVLLADCMNVTREGNQLRGIDCVNGTLLSHDLLPQPFMNFTQFWKIYKNSDRMVDPSQRYLPNQHNLTIYNLSRLFINLDGCVNTLRGECVDFALSHGSDGDNNTAESRYLCYYNKKNADIVIARMDLTKTLKELLIALIIPIILFFISVITLCTLARSVKVGDDTIMRWKGEEDDSVPDMKESYVVTTNKKSRERFRVEVDNSSPASEINEQIREIDLLETHAMSGSTKSLIPPSQKPNDLVKKMKKSFSIDNSAENPLIMIRNVTY